MTSIKNFSFGGVWSSIKSSLSDPSYYTLLISALLVLGGFLLNRIIIRMINNRVQDATRRHVFRKIINYSMTFLITIILLFTWIRNLTFITAITGFLAAGLAIAMRDVIMSFFGWFKIIGSRPFKVGDRIQIQELEGDVIDISPLHTVLLEVGNWVQAKQSTGRVVFLPNNIVFTQSVYNSTHGFPYLWDEFSVVVTFESDLEVATELMQEPVEDAIGINYKKARQEIQKMGDRYAISYEEIGSRTYKKIVDSGVELTLRYLTTVRGRREIRSRITDRVMNLLNETPDVELAYPTYRIYKRGEHVEGEGRTGEEPMKPDDS